MSRRAYKVKYTKAQVNEKARKLATRKLPVRVPTPKQKALSKLHWLPVQNEEFTTPEDLREVEVPDEWTAEDGTRKEKVLVSADKEGLTVIVSDANLKEGSCERIVRNFAGLVYKEVTGEELREDEVDLSPFAMFRHTICEFCGEQTEGNSFTCPVCKRCFCYDHRSPESHGCNREKSRGETVEFGSKASRSDSGKERRTTVAIRKIFCG